MIPMSRFWSPIVATLAPYQPGEQADPSRVVKLNTNENPYGPSSSTLTAIQGVINDTLRLYPDPRSLTLRQALAERHGTEPKNVFVGNGSDEVLAFVFQALLCHEQPILLPDLTYSFYESYCRLYGIRFIKVPLGTDFAITPSDYMKPNGGIVLANPNAPTGIALSLQDIEGLLADNPDSVIVVDEAYVDFGAQSCIPLTLLWPNLLVVQTFSKSRSLAGLRVGFAVGHEDLITALERVKDSVNSYPLGRLSQAGALASLQDEDYFEQTRRQIMDTRDLLKEQLKALGFEVLPSLANFVFARHATQPAEDLYQRLKHMGILVRHLPGPRSGEFLRITVGTKEACAKLIEALTIILDT